MKKFIVALLFVVMTAAYAATGVVTGFGANRDAAVSQARAQATRLAGKSTYKVLHRLVETDGKTWRCTLVIEY
jgi:beta-lactamase class D